MATSAQHKALQNTYFQQQINSASQEQLLLMLYDGAIRFLKQALQHMAAGELQETHNQLMKTQKILLEFMASLDVNTGGEPAKNLMKLYEYYHHQLVQANVKKEAKPIEEVMEHLKNLRNTWAEAIKIAKNEAKQTRSATVIDEDAQGAVIYGKA
jgi:flagellar secretion chaperone FliS